MYRHKGKRADPRFLGKSGIPCPRPVRNIYGNLTADEELEVQSDYANQGISSLYGLFFIYPLSSSICMQKKRNTQFAF